jgi:hypothetical protein
MASSEQTTKMSTENRKLTDESDSLAGAAASSDFGLFRTQTYLLRRHGIDRGPSETKPYQQMFFQARTGSFGVPTAARTM